MKQDIIEFSVIHDGFCNSGMPIRPVGDCMKEPSLRGGAADAAIQKVFAGIDAAGLPRPATLCSRLKERLTMSGQLISPAIAFTRHARNIAM